MSETAILIVTLIARYGLPFTLSLIQTLQKSDWTVADLAALEKLIDKPGESYFVPAVTP